MHTYMYKKRNISEDKFSLRKVQKYINKQLIWITKPYMKAFFEEKGKKDIPSYVFFFPMFLM